MVIFIVSSQKPIRIYDRSRHQEIKVWSEEFYDIDTLSDKDFQIKGQGIFIELEDAYENIVINEKAVSISDVDEDHAYYTYVYENFILSVSPINGTIFCINLVTSEFETDRGIRVGDHISDVFKKYGLVDENLLQCYAYYYNHKMLIFYVDKDERVVDIKLEMI